MRILSVVGRLEKGGTERVAQNFAVSYARLGHASAVLAHSEGGLREAILRDRGIETFVGNGNLQKISSFVDGFKPDVIHIHRPGMGSPFELELLRVLRTGDRRVLETNVFSRVDYGEAPALIDVHLQLSSWCMWKWRKCLGRRQANQIGVVVPNAVEPSGFERAAPEQVAAFRRSHQIAPDAFVCGRIGQASPSKWHPQTIAAFAHVAEQDPKATLLLVGLPASLRSRIDRLQSNIRQRILLLPTTTSDQELSLIYSSMDCFVHAATIGESFGLVLAEAMLCGCPVVTCSRPDRDNSQVEVVGHNEGGLVAASVQSLPEALQTIWHDTALRQRLATQARFRILQRFEADNVAARTVRLAELALQHPDRNRLREAIHAEGCFQTAVSDEEIERLLQDTIGRASWIELMRKRLVHNAWFQRALIKLRRRK